MIRICFFVSIVIIPAAAFGQDRAARPVDEPSPRQADRVVGRSRLEGHPRARALARRRPAERRPQGPRPPGGVRRRTGRHLVRRLGPRPAPRPASRGRPSRSIRTGPCGSTARRPIWNAPALAVRLEDFTLFIVAAPFSNAGGFRAFLAMHEQGQVDFTSGVTVDMGSGFTARFDTLNVEGEGFGGMLNLMAEPSDFGVVRRMTVTSVARPRRHEALRRRQGRTLARPQPSVLDVDRIIVGARFFGFPPAIRGFLDGDILQVLVYDRVLDEAERREVEDYLAARLDGKSLDHAAAPGRAAASRWSSVPNPPPVQMLVPGFSVRELPVDLTNINNVKYRADGKLVALSYAGDIYLLSDRDGDGLEETVERFWENKGSLVAPIGMALTPAGYRAGRRRLRRLEGEDLADRRHRPRRQGRQGDHRRQRMEGAAARRRCPGRGPRRSRQRLLRARHDRLHQRLSGRRRGPGGLRPEATSTARSSRSRPTSAKREIVATGIRFPVALAFNRLGDLFATDQEGATWLANGNPFDELLHIQPKRHYGFPPRHPRHLPSVIDEPSVFDYGPQHQSTCGLNFNEPVNGGPIFGPAHWAGDALVTGYSRGKLFRTKLAKTPSGYVAQNQLLAVLNMLAADACVSPRGDLVVAAHSGLPDWGSGPKGKGKLYKIAYSDREVAPAGARLGRGPAGGLHRVRPPARPGASCTTWPGRSRSNTARASARRPVRVAAAGLRGGGPADGRAPIRAADPLGPGLGRPPLAARSPPPRTRRRLPTRSRFRASVGPTRRRPDPARSRRSRRSISATTCPASRRPGGPSRATDAWSGWLPHLDLASPAPSPRAAPTTIGSGTRSSARAGSR